MAYGLKYQTQFTSVSDANIPSKNYTLQFLFKDYTGASVSAIGGDNAVIQRCTIEDPVAAIKGQSLDISLINKGGALPITAFQSEVDDAIQVKLLDENNQILFIGYTVQDDFYEIKVDYEHQITLSANDGLGLLKGVPLPEGLLTRRYSVILLEVPGFLDNFYISSDDPSFNPTVGGTIEILGVVYNIEATTALSLIIGGVNYNWMVRVNPDTPGWVTPITETVVLIGPLNLLNRNRIIDIIAVCLSSTNISLVTNIYHNLYAYQQTSDRSTWEYTLIDSQVFIAGDSYQDCYTVLQTILETYNCQIFQANGQWNIINWHEARYYSNIIPCFVYDETFAFMGTGTFTNIFNIGPDPQLSRPKFSLTSGFMRGYKFSKKKFEYKQPKYLLQNYDLQELGALIRQYVSGTDTVYEYVATSWTDIFTGITPSPERFIRVVKDSSGTEIDRALVVRGATGDNSRSVQGIPFEISEGDKIKFSFSVQTNYSYAGPSTVIFAVRLYDGTDTRYIDETPIDNGAWIGSVGFNYSISSGDNFNTLHNVEIASSQAPFSGLLYCYLAQLDPSTGTTARETWYRDIRVEYTPYVNDNSKIIAQIHTQTQPPEIKNNSDKEILIDDSPRNSIAGTIFRNTKTGLLQDKTDFWRYPPDANGWRLGERTTLQDLLWRQRTRSKLEGGFIGNYQAGTIISLLTLAITDFEPTKNYTFGLLTIDFKNNQFSGTLWELYDQNDVELDNNYELKYLYSAK